MSTKGNKIELKGTIQEILSHAETQYDCVKLNASVRTLLKKQRAMCRAAAMEILSTAGVSNSGIAQRICDAILGAR